MTGKKPFVPVVAVLNMKGGVGKTTVSAALARLLFERKRLGTLMIDLDPQFNLTQALYTRQGYEKLKTAGKTIAAVMEPPSDVGLFAIKTTSEPPPDPADVTDNFYYFRKANPPINLDLVPGDFALVKYSLMDDNKQLKSVRERFTKFVNVARAKYGLIIIDCNPSSSFLTLCALHVCSHILAPIRPDRYSVLGLEILSEFVKGVPSISPKPQFVVLLNGIPRTGGISAIEAELRGHPEFGSKTLGNVIRESAHLRARPDYTGFSIDRTGPWSSVMKREVSAVADELATKLGL